MKKILVAITLAAFVATPASLLAKKAAAPATTPAATTPAAAAPAAAAPAAAAATAAVAAVVAPVAAVKSLPMTTAVDAIDAATKSFTHNNKDGSAVKFVVTATTVIKNGETDAKFEDIKVGDTVNGLRVKKSATEYEVTKITSFGPKAAKKGADKKAAAPAAAAPAAVAPAAAPAPVAPAPAAPVAK
ncbi:MAG: hypothetical protein WCI46_06875 [Verrucomicrobiota bacterium]